MTCYGLLIYTCSQTRALGAFKFNCPLFKVIAKIWIQIDQYTNFDSLSKYLHILIVVLIVAFIKVASKASAWLPAANSCTTHSMYRMTGGQHRQPTSQLSTSIL